MTRKSTHRKAKTSRWVLPVVICIVLLVLTAGVLYLYDAGYLKPVITAGESVLVKAGLRTTTAAETVPVTEPSAAPTAEPTTAAVTVPDTVTETEPETVTEPETEPETTPGLRPAPTPTPSATPQPEAVNLEFPYYITINKGAQLVTVYTLDSDGTYSIPVRYMICSTGERDKTPSGLFKVKDKHRWQRMLASQLTYAQYASRITGSYLFHSVNFHNNRADDLKVENYNNLGTLDSGGCVRLQVADAKWVYENIPTGTPVRIFIGAPQPEITLNLLPERLDAKAKWDPSDPDEANPDPHEVPGFEILNTPYPGTTAAPLSETFSPDVARVTRTLPPG